MQKPNSLELLFKWLEQVDFHMQNLNLTLDTQINSIWIIDLNVKSKAIKFLEKKRQNLWDLKLDNELNEFLDLIPKT